MLALCYFKYLTELCLIDQVSAPGSNSACTCMHLQLMPGVSDDLMQRIERIEGLQQCPHLKKLCLIENRISAIENLEACTALEELYLTSNRVTQLCNLDHLTALKVSSLHST